MSLSPLVTIIQCKHY